MIEKTELDALTLRTYFKRHSAPYLWLFLGINLVIFLSLFFSKGLSSSSVDYFWKRVTGRDGVIATSIPLLAIILGGLLDDTTKARLVFWRWHDPLPGCRVFTELMNIDPRIDLIALRGKHLEGFPREPREQNALWYKWYKKHITSIHISEAHKIYLLTRDMACLAALLALLFSFGIFTDSVSWEIALLYAAALVSQYVILATAARNYGIRFVLNVLTEESHSNT
jgi:hypothetical protein